MNLKEELYNLAHTYVPLRLEVNKGFYSGKDKERKGLCSSVLFEEKKEMDYVVEFKGILAELIVRDYLDSNGYSYTASAFIKSKGNNEPDIIVDGVKIDVKGCEGKPKVNVATLIRSVAIEYYFVIFKSRTEFELLKLKKKDIAKWKLVTAQGGSVYYEQR